MCWGKGTSVKANLAERGGVWEGSAVVSSIGILFLELRGVSGLAGWEEGKQRGQWQRQEMEAKLLGSPGPPPEA